MQSVICNKRNQPNDPLAYAMKASLHTNKDLNSFNSYGQKTLAAARRLMARPPRGVYAAVGHFLQGAAVMTRDGTERNSTSLS